MNFYSSTATVAVKIIDSGRITRKKLLVDYWTAQGNPIKHTNPKLIVLFYKK